MGKAIVYGAVGGIVVTFVGVAGACLFGGWELSTAIGLGVFASIWSGLGFGFMFGGIVYVTKLEALQEAERKAARVPVAAAPDPMVTSEPRSTTLA